MNAHADSAMLADASWAASAFWQRVRAAPHGHDLFHLLRWLDARAGAGVPLGRASHPADEPIRVGQRASLSFAPSMVATLSEGGGDKPHLSILGFGLFGPNGALPLHLTEYARERERVAGDPTLVAFADLFHHRLALLFYRAWADAQATVNLDRPDAARFDTYVASLLAMGLPAQQKPGAIGLHARYCQAGHLVRQSRNPEGLIAILRRYLGVPVALQEYRTTWIALAPEDRLALGAGSARLPLGQATLGRAVRDAQSRFRIVLGPLPLATFRQFLPGGAMVALLTDWVDEYVGLDLGWDVQLELAASDVPRAALNTRLPLGLCTWLGARRPDTQARPDRHLIIDYRKRQAARATASTTSRNSQ